MKLSYAWERSNVSQNNVFFQYKICNQKTREIILENLSAQ